MPVRRIGILGGTFDPVHFGHLRFAIEFRDALALDGADSRVHLIPCHIPPHRGAPGASPVQRLDMLRLALEGRSGLQVDTREMESDGPSYTVDTLLSLRNAFPDAQLVLAIGLDAFAGFCTWHRWREILDIASIVVASRPGAVIEDEAVCGLLTAREVGIRALDRPGQIARLEMTPLSISSSRVRELIAARGALDFLLPDAVIDYIGEQALYQS